MVYYPLLYIYIYIYIHIYIYIYIYIYIHTHIYTQHAIVLVVSVKRALPTVFKKGVRQRLKTNQQVLKLIKLDIHLSF